MAPGAGTGRPEGPLPAGGSHSGSKVGRGRVALNEPNAPSMEQLFAHMWWADSRVLEALEAVPDPPARAVELYAHVLGAELIWLDRIEGVPQSVAVWPPAELAAGRELARRCRERYRSFLDRLDPGELSRPVHYANSAGQEFDTPIEDILLHVALHGAYHRGQVALLLRDAGAEPAPTDYIAFIRGAPAAIRQGPR